MNIRSPISSKAALVILALTAGIGWRVELELRSGWPGLFWLEYFHWAVPLFVIAFIGWVAVYAPVRRRSSFIAALIAFAIAGFVVTSTALAVFFAAGPDAFAMVLSLGDGNTENGIRLFSILRWLAVIVWPLLPLGFCLLCRLFGLPITLRWSILSAVMFTLSWPVAMLIRIPFARDTSDLIHALKSGAVIPFLILALGMPLLNLPSLKQRE